MNKHSFTRLVLCAALTCGTATLFAQAPGPGPGDFSGAGGPPHGHHGPPPSALFRALDTNGDGVISADEIANAPAALKSLTDASGQITHESLRPPRHDRDDQRPGQDDTHPHRPRPDAGRDADGGPAPRPQRPPAAEAEHGPHPADASPAADASSAGGGAPADRRPERPHGPPHGDRLFDALDANGDGVISAEEIAAAAAALKKADTNGDGVIDRRDFRPPPPPRPAPAE